MQTFGRLLSVLTFLISLGLFAQALPSPVRSGALAARDYSNGGYNSPSGYSHPDHGGYGGHHNDDDSYNHSGYSSPSGYDGSKPSQSSDIDVLAIVTGLKEQCDPAIALLAKADTVDVVNVQVAAIVGLVKTACGSLVGVTVNVAADVKVKIAQCVVDLIVAIITACAAVTVKLGASVCLALWAQIDVCLHLLLLTLHVCVDGLLKLIIDLCLNLDVTILAKLNILDLQLCVKILGLAAKLAGLSH